MTNTAEADAQTRLVLCLDDIDGFESLTVRMPTPEECQNGIPADIPVLVMQRHGNHADILRGDLITVTIAPEPIGGADEIRTAAEYILGSIIESLSNTSFDLADLAKTMATSPRNIVKKANELRQRRAEE